MLHHSSRKKLDYGISEIIVALQNVPGYNRATALAGKDARPAKVAGTVLVPTYAHVLLFLSPQLKRNNDGMQINCTSQGKTITIKKARKFLLFLPTQIPQLGYEACNFFSKDLAFFNYARTTEHPSNLASQPER